MLEDQADFLEDKQLMKPNRPKLERKSTVVGQAQVGDQFGGNVIAEPCIPSHKVIKLFKFTNPAISVKPIGVRGMSPGAHQLREKV